MGKGQKLISRLTEQADASGQLSPMQPIVEIAGDRRVLIENHFGVQEYSPGRIAVKVRYGVVSVCGSCLQILRMTGEQLVIGGRIENVALQRERQG